MRFFLISNLLWKWAGKEGWEMEEEEEEEPSVVYNCLEFVPFSASSAIVR